ncbi:Dicer-like protein 1 [Ascosphaera pollenicola]|nr:Dicer-like protein 1 [Ascosphaera pollenicola]
MADMVEAYIGAIFIDSNFEYEVVQDFFDKFVKDHFEDMTIYDTFANKHPTTFLHNKLAQEFECQNYSLKAAEVPFADGMESKVVAAVIIHGKVVVDAMMNSTQSAKVKASQKALEELSGLSFTQFRLRYGCDCHKKKEEEQQKETE